MSIIITHLGPSSKEGRDKWKIFMQEYFPENCGKINCSFYTISRIISDIIKISHNFSDGMIIMGVDVKRSNDQCYMCFHLKHNIYTYLELTFNNNEYTFEKSNHRLSNFLN